MGLNKRLGYFGWLVKLETGVWPIKEPSKVNAATRAGSHGDAAAAGDDAQ